jgi:DNA polymerase-3 subunit epsilon
MEELRPIYYDTETTGVKSGKDRIIEIAAYDPIENRSFVELINPECPIPKEASAIHHITDEMVKEAPTFKSIAEKFIQFCPANTVLIAHNNDAFDKLFLEAEYKRVEVALPFFQYVDTLKWARKYRNDLPRHSLQFLRETYGFAANQAHRALDDVIILYQVFSVMIDDLPIQKVIQLLSAPQVISRMPFGKHQGKPLEEVPRNYVSWLASSGAFDKPENKELKQSFEKLGALTNNSLSV